MALVATPAVILRGYRYSETSKVVRLATRELGVQSAIAKGALRPRSPFGAGLELLSEGVAQLYHRDSRELQTLAGFEVTTLRRELATDLGRFAGGTTLAEVMLKMAPPAALPSAYDILVAGLVALATAPLDAVDATAVRALWRLLGVLGFEPSLVACARDGASIEAGDGPFVIFSAAEGGALCARCAAAGASEGASRLPPPAFRALLALNDPAAILPVLDAAHAAAHRRLVARFTRHHLDEGGSPALPALEFWERRAWIAAS
jgi:DNA repair protein RecO (recombination protein O)